MMLAPHETTGALLHPRARLKLLRRHERGYRSDLPNVRSGEDWQEESSGGRDRSGRGARPHSH